jgi:hypothetical protein
VAVPAGPEGVPLIVLPTRFNPAGRLPDEMDQV